ncbi:thiamine-phosphate kinase [Candidatus Kinetoplastidibacterium crithidiae]|uniref:Thiamine-monophosphate kinase n=1 Tax=Candidatus Kinetoplastidibacterium crithidiae TCC036E TaxID=1208918 RepID=M1M5Z4_9PROT|nr:thiamine-phosphate kinase [Candidatus Kinetoplastibacterium crithidii]AFZ82782.1 thiamine-monophosphate kinase [Candidatus Kinetoplastibacterium crithidii (ex Angomonas deanei ATCC 30255)]AGF47565.1 thiamine-monophosphate kinase [Candidatus Kinetoplastibacterium crithidii TCC036E]
MSEFDIIRKYFSKSVVQKSMLGVGDDCALFTVPHGNEVAVSKDLLIEGKHFFSNVDPVSLGHKSLAVNLSDLAAMGAQPIGCLLGIAIPTVDHRWLSKFSKGFFKLSNEVACPLLGGDTVKSSSGISISITVFGAVPVSQAIRRNGAKLNDEIWISGNLGSADIAYRIITKQIMGSKSLLRRTIRALDWPNPRIHLGRCLLGIANSAIDISDGFLQDLSHITRSSNLGANIYYDEIPFDKYLEGKVSQEDIKKAILNGGDVYELCFTASKSNHNAIRKISNDTGIVLHMVGKMVSGKSIKISPHDRSILYDINGFNHF